MRRCSAARSADLLDGVRDSARAPGHLLCGGRVLLRYRVDALDGRDHLFPGGVDLLSRSRDLADLIGDPADCPEDVPKGVAGLLGLDRAFGHLPCAVFDRAD